MIDILFLARQRKAFTAASLRTLMRNTPADLINWLHIYTDGDDSYFGPNFWVEAKDLGIRVNLVTARFGGPVAIMNAFLDTRGTDVFAKIDNDVIVPRLWLESCLQVMNLHPELDLLGIEPPASRTPSRAGGKRMEEPEFKGPLVKSSPAVFGYGVTPSIGGIGLMRRSAWKACDRMTVSGFRGVGGFTSWQLAANSVTKGWIAPPLKVFLLDRLPIEPWVSLSDRYIAGGVQRPWERYDLKDSDLWDWWTACKMDRRLVVSKSEQPDGCFGALLECGHMSILVVGPVPDVMPCGQCVMDCVADHKA